MLTKIVKWRASKQRQTQIIRESAQAKLLAHYQERALKSILEISYQGWVHSSDDRFYQIKELALQALTRRRE